MIDVPAAAPVVVPDPYVPGPPINKAVTLKIEKARNSNQEHIDAVTSFCQKVVNAGTTLKEAMYKLAGEDRNVITAEQAMGWFKEMGMSDEECARLMRVSGFEAKAKKGQPLAVESVARFMNDCANSGKHFGEDTLVECAAYCKEAGINKSNAFAYFDEDKNGVVERGELFSGFKRMGVKVNKRHIASLYVILDENYDHEISAAEFEEIFAGYLEDGTDADKEAALALKKERTEGAE